MFSAAQSTRSLSSRDSDPARSTHVRVSPPLVSVGSRLGACFVIADWHPNALGVSAGASHAIAAHSGERTDAIEASGQARVEKLGNMH